LQHDQAKDGYWQLFLGTALTGPAWLLPQQRAAAQMAAGAARIGRWWWLPGGAVQCDAAVGSDLGDAWS
jgi:hypothetical protein